MWHQTNLNLAGVGGSGAKKRVFVEADEDEEEDDDDDDEAPGAKRTPGTKWFVSGLLTATFFVLYYCENCAIQAF